MEKLDEAKIDVRKLIRDINTIHNRFRRELDRINSFGKGVNYNRIKKVNLRIDKLFKCLDSQEESFNLLNKKVVRLEESIIAMNKKQEVLF